MSFTRAAGNVMVLHIPITVVGEEDPIDLSHRRWNRRRKSETLPSNDCYYNKRGRVVKETVTELQELQDENAFPGFEDVLTLRTRISKPSSEDAVQDKPRAVTPSSSPASTRSNEAARASSASSSDSSDVDEEEDNFRQEALEKHNEKRKKHGVQPLTLDKELCAFASQWARKLAAEDRFQHRHDCQYGENLYCSWNSNPKVQLSASDVVESWYSEVAKYQYGTEPNSTGAGHFTQIVWKASQAMGIGKARTAKGKTIVVANYDPPGNFIGRYVENVMPPKPSS